MKFHLQQIGMSWQYSIEWHDTKTVRKSIVMVTSKPRSQSDLIRAKSWTQSQILYLKLLKGQSPIIGAKISAKIIKINGDQVAQIGLDDNGFGGKHFTIEFYFVKLQGKLD